MDTRRLTVGSLKKQTVKPSADLKRSKKWTKGDFKDKKTVKSIDVAQNNKVYTIIPKANNTLLKSALDQNQMLSYKCQKGTCGKCMVKVLKGMECLQEPTAQENKKLQNKLKQGYRLACQTKIEKEK